VAIPLLTPWKHPVPTKASFKATFEILISLEAHLHRRRSSTDRRKSSLDAVHTNNVFAQMPANNFDLSYWEAKEVRLREQMRDFVGTCD
jgi:hypothetical protein